MWIGGFTGNGKVRVQTATARYEAEVALRSFRWDHVTVVWTGNEIKLYQNGAVGVIYCKLKFLVITGYHCFLVLLLLQLCLSNLPMLDEYIVWMLIIS